MAGRSGFGRWNKMTGEFEWKDSVMPVGPRRARNAGLPMNLRLYTTREAAVVLRHSVYWVRDQIKAGRIRARKFGNGYFITVLELARVMGETSFGGGGSRVCWNASENFGKKLPRRKLPRVTNIPGNGTSPGLSTAGSAVSGRAIFTSGRPAAPRPLITSPGK